MEMWKSFGDDLKAGICQRRRPCFSVDGQAYAYIYDQVLSEAYVVKGLK
jgi:hypothetical protein